MGFLMVLFSCGVALVGVWMVFFFFFFDSGSPFSSDTSLHLESGSG